MAELDLTVEENAVSLDMEIEEAQTVYENDHSRLVNRDAVDSHPISAITGLAGTLQTLAGDINVLERNQASQGEAISSLGETQASQGETISSLGETQTSQGERISSLEDNIMLPMTAEEARNILNAE